MLTSQGGAPVPRPSKPQRVENAQYAVALSELGRHPNTAILRAIERGPMRFHEVAAELADFREAAVSAGLRELDADGLIARRVDSGPPLRVLYELTQLGAELTPALRAVADWSDRANRQ